MNRKISKKSKFFLSLTLILLLTFSVFLTLDKVTASSKKYIRINKDEVYIYDKTTSQKLFVVPNSYFVEFVKYDDSKIIVKYGDIEGYILKTKDTLKEKEYESLKEPFYRDGDFANPKAMMPKNNTYYVAWNKPTDANLDYKYSDVKAEDIKSVKLLGIANKDFYAVQIVYNDSFIPYGPGKNNALANNIFFVSKASTNKPILSDIPVNDYQEKIASIDGNKDKPSTPINNVARVVFTILITVACIVIVLIVFRLPRKNKDEYSD